MHRGLGSATTAAGFPRGRQPKFPMGEIPLRQYSCKKSKTLPAPRSTVSHLAVVHHVANAAIPLFVCDARWVGGVGIATTQLQQCVDVEEGVLTRCSLLDAAG